MRRITCKTAACSHAAARARETAASACRRFEAIHILNLYRAAERGLDIQEGTELGLHSPWEAKPALGTDHSHVT